MGGGDYLQKSVPYFPFLAYQRGRKCVELTTYEFPMEDVLGKRHQKPSAISQDVTLRNEAGVVFARANHLFMFRKVLLLIVINPMLLQEKNPISIARGYAPPTYSRVVWRSDSVLFPSYDLTRIVICNTDVLNVTNVIYLLPYVSL